MEIKQLNPKRLRKKPLSILGAIEPERDRIITNIINYMKNHFETKTVGANWCNKEEHEQDEITCSCGWKHWSDRDYWSSEGELRAYDLWQYSLYSHICYEIKSKASKEHIDILEEVFGKEILIKLLNHWGERNIFIGTVLKQYASELNRTDFKEKE